MDWQNKKVQENCITELRAQLLELFQADDDNDDNGLAAKLECVKENTDKISGEEVVKVVWAVIVQTQNSVGKNQMQIFQMLVKAIKENLPLLQAITKSMKHELTLMNCIQTSCYEDSKLLKVRCQLTLVSLSTVSSCTPSRRWRR